MSNYPPGSDLWALIDRLWGQSAAGLRADLATPGPGSGTDLIEYRYRNLNDAVTRKLTDKLDDIISVSDFGTSGFDNGSSDAGPAFRKAVEKAKAYGKSTIYVPSGNYVFSSQDHNQPSGLQTCVYCEVNSSIEFICEADANLIADPAIHPASIFRFQTSSYTNPARRLFFTGGRFDLSLVQTNVTGTTAISTGPKFEDVQYRYVYFDHGTTTPAGLNLGYGGGDTGSTIKEPEHLVIDGCLFVGAPDIGAYLSGDNNIIRNGRRAVVQNSYFYRCVVGVAVKRYFKQTIVSSNHFEECGDAMIFGAADDIPTNHGNLVIFCHNWIEKMQGVPLRADNSDYVLAFGNVMIDWRRLISDPTIETPVALGNRGGAISASGVKHGGIFGNVCAFRDWLPVTTDSKESYGVALKTLAATGEGCSNIYVGGNTMDNVYSEIYVSPECYNLELGRNSKANIIAPPEIHGSVSYSELHATYDFADDASAAAGGVPINGIYHSNGQMKIRLS